MVTIMGPSTSVTMSVQGEPGEVEGHFNTRSLSVSGYDVVSSSVNGRVSRVEEFREQRPSSPRARHSGAVVGVVVEEAPLHTIVAGVRDDEESFGINGGCSGIQQLCRS